MTKPFILPLALVMGTVVVLTRPAGADLSATSQVSARKQQVIDLLKSIETGAPGPVAVINPKKYTQHNLGAADGLAGFGELMKQLPPGSAKVNTRRVLQDGDFVIAHTEYNFFGPKIGFDIFRFEGDQIVEHWDNLQTTRAAPNAAGRTHDRRSDCDHRSRSNGGQQDAGPQLRGRLLHQSASREDRHLLRRHELHAAQPGSWRRQRARSGRRACPGSRDP